MYRRSLEKNTKAEDSPGKMEVSENIIKDIQFLNRICQLPVVTASWTQLAGFYSQAKQSNRLFKFTLDMAESGVQGVASTAVPLVNKFEKPSMLNYEFLY